MNTFVLRLLRSLAPLVLIAAGCNNSPPGGAVDDLAMRLDGGMADMARGDMARTDDAGPRDPKVTMCPGANLPPATNGVCDVTAGNGAKLITGTILVPGEVLRGGQVAVDDTGKIICAACDCSAMAQGATKITCPTGVVSPGLINSHDHITYTQDSPDADSGERYEQRHDWRIPKRGHTKIPSTGGATSDQVSWGELRFVIGGATSTVGSGSAAGFLRNLDRAQQENLGQPQVHFETFPLGDSNGTQLESGCGYPMILTADSIKNDPAFFPHISEGIDAVARNEFLCTSSSMNGGQDLAQPQTAIIHAVGLRPNDYALMARDSVALVWSPRSNVRLYGDTAVAPVASRLGVLIALGTDWTASGSMNMLRELRCADLWNNTYYDRYFTDEELWLMATLNAAIATATDDVIGALKPGLVADIAIFDGSVNKDHRAVIAAEPKDVALVLRGGKVLYGEAQTVSKLPGGDKCDALDVCGGAKAVCVTGEINKSFSALKTAAGSSYALFFCGTPMNEPTCLPSRPKSVMGSTIYDGKPKAGMDDDGDGILNTMDNCPRVFNPIRPVDEGKQGDLDGDKVGDACDPCPLDANTTMCKPADPNDNDSDGITNGMDNCPDAGNADQKDGDMDGKGDVCDPCPMVPNPGAEACPVSIYDVKKGVAMVGQAVQIKKGLATGVHAAGFFLQVKKGDPDYAGAEYSGVYVYSPAHTVKVGDRVTLLTSTVSSYKPAMATLAQIQLVQSMIRVDSSGEPAPAPVTESAPGVSLKASDIATGGPKAAAFESVLVQLATPKVTDIMPMPGTGDVAPTNEFVVDGSLRVNDLFFAANTFPFPLLNDTYGPLTGIAEVRNDNMKIEPRDGSDMVPGVERLIGFSAASSFTRVGGMDVPTIPQPLAVMLNRAAKADILINVTSSDPNSLTVQSPVKVAMGQKSAPILVTGIARSMSVTLTADYNGDKPTATVRVLDGSDVPALASLTPPNAVVLAGAMQTFTVALDLPAPMGGTQVMVSAVSGMVSSPTVTIAADQTEATFVYTGGMAMTDTVTAQLGMTMKTATVVGAKPHLVINEVDYDQIGTDNNEFVEIYNPGGTAVDLAPYALVMVNGSNNMEYLRVALAGMLPAGGYCVVGASTVKVPMGVIKIDFKAAADSVQNGSPDGIALINVNAKTVEDALSYEGSMTMAQIMGIANPVNLVEGKATPEVDSNTMDGSLSRLPNGKDTDDASVDWKFTGTITPGLPNM